MSLVTGDRALTLPRFAQALRTKPALFLLGAGASAPFVPMGRALAESVARARRGSYGIKPVAHDERAQTFRRLVMPRRSLLTPDEAWERDLLDRIPDATWQIEPLRTIAEAATLQEAPPGYGVFTQFPPTTVINYNIDGLAERFCRPRHRVVTAHGLAPPGMAGAAMAEVAEGLYESDASAIAVPGLTFIETEGSAVAARLPSTLGACAFVVIVGYTFANGPAGFQDATSLRRMIALLKRLPKPVVVVDPAASTLVADTLEAETRSARIYTAHLNWHVFAGALMGLSGRDERGIERAYRVAEDEYERRR